MTIQMLESKFDKFVAYVGLVGKELNQLQAEIRAAREAEEALQEAAYQEACREGEEGLRMLEALGNDAPKEQNRFLYIDAHCHDMQVQDLTEKYMKHLYC